MTDEKLEELWKQVEHVGKVDHLCDDAMIALGSAFGKMRAQIVRQREALEFYADKENYSVRIEYANNCPTNKVMSDNGNKARKALGEYE